MTSVVSRYLDVLSFLRTVARMLRAPMSPTKFLLSDEPYIIKSVIVFVRWGDMDLQLARAAMDTVPSIKAKPFLVAVP